MDENIFKNANSFYNMMSILRKMDQMVPNKTVMKTLGIIIGNSYTVFIIIIVNN